MREANETEKEIILANRHILNQECRESFYINMSERLTSGIKVMGLEDIQIALVYCSSLNKHTCIETIQEIPDTYFFVLDGHLQEMLSSLGYLFYAFGTNDFKNASWTNLLEMLPAHQKRLKSTACLFLAEKSLIDCNLNKAEYYMDEFDKCRLNNDDYKGEFGKYELNLFMLKFEREKMAEAFSMNFYVFHELAHIVYAKKRNQMDECISAYHSYSDTFEEMYHSAIKAFPDEKVDYPYEDIICDAYALVLLFEMVYENYKEFNYEYMVNSYICPITNLTILDSIITRDHVSETWYVLCWVRIMAALNIAGTVLSIRKENPKILFDIQNRMEHCHMVYKNFKEIILNEIKQIESTGIQIVEQYATGSKEWLELYNKIIARIKEIR